jgi:hypothetical protein
MGVIVPRAVQLGTIHPFPEDSFLKNEKERMFFGRRAGSDGGQKRGTQGRKEKRWTRMNADRRG